MKNNVAKLAIAALAATGAGPDTTGVALALMFGLVASLP